jgi:aspartyl-tRNA(Asn)/glutamyl-tRNA(Gln) amidotransferase subunit C
MGLTEKDVKYVARLARLGLSDEEAKTAAVQLGAILEYAEMLNQLDTEKVEPTSHVLPLSNVLRKDEVTPSMDRDSILANAPDKAKGCFRVPKILEASKNDGGAS